MGFKRENWNGTYVWVARADGKLQTYRKVKGSQLNKEQAGKILKRNNTFWEDRVKTKLTNVTENIYITPTTSSNRTARPTPKPRGQPMYVVEGIYNKQKIVGVSHKYGSIIGSMTSRECKDEAWENFLLRLSQAHNSALYDADKGLRILEQNNVSHLREGWIFYK